MGLRLNTRNIQLVIKYLDLSTGPNSGSSPAARPLSRTIVRRRSVDGGAFFSVVLPVGCQLRQRFLRRNVNTQRQNVETGPVAVSAAEPSRRIKINPARSPCGCTIAPATRLPTQVLIGTLHT